VKYPSEPRWLVETKPKIDPAWGNFVVMVLDGQDRSHYGLSHDGQRFSRSNDLQRLCDDYPTVAEEVTAWAETR
jgi:hypothetical protein